MMIMGIFKLEFVDSSGGEVCQIYIFGITFGIARCFEVVFDDKQDKYFKGEVKER